MLTYVTSGNHIYKYLQFTIFIPYISSIREHWFTIRRLGSQWFNLNSLLEGPELVSNTYLGEFLAQLQHEGYDIFLVTGDVSNNYKVIFHP